MPSVGKFFRKVGDDAKKFFKKGGVADVASASLETH